MRALAAVLVASSVLGLAVPARVGAQAAPGPQGGSAAKRAPSLVLLTLDTTRADHLGSYGSEGADTPTLDALAGRGTRYATALSASPLTLPSHVSLFTGLRPPDHGVRDNGSAALADSAPTLATVLSGRGYETGAFVSSRVLDRRFGLASGFDTYDDQMTAENLGQYGYPERDAAAVTTAAVEWLSWLSPSDPYFIWVHYYDPHLPYAPPETYRQGSTAGDYAGEIAFMDRQIGRLLQALPSGAPEPIIAVVGDHGEALGEHGEESHGIFLYGASLEVPLVLAGPGIPQGQVVDEVVASRRLTATLLRLLGAKGEAESLGAGLPGIPSLGADPAPEPAYSESRMPASAYGWSPLEALTDQRWRLIEAPRPELYDLAADPEERHNVIDKDPARAERMSEALEEIAASEAPSSGASVVDPQLAADLRALGYLSDAGSEAGTIDPKDGVAMLAEWDRAKELLQAGDAAGSAAAMRALSARNPENIPFLSHLARAELAAGNTEAGLAAFRRAIELNPRLDFLHLSLAAAYAQLGLTESARSEFQSALQLNPRQSKAWLGLAEIALRSGQADEERRLLLEAVGAETGSAAIRARLGQIEGARGDLAAASAHFERATVLAPEWALGWFLWAQNAEAMGHGAAAIERYRRAAEVAPDSAEGREARRRAGGR